MERLRAQLESATAACWDSVSTACPALQSGLNHLGQSLRLVALPGGAASGATYELHGREYRVVRQLGEGGYSFVYLVRQLGAGSTADSSISASGPLAAPAAGAPQGQLFALKRVLCGGEEQVREAEAEVAVMRRVRHPCIMPLLDAATTRQRTPDGGLRHVVLMLFPVYDGGNLFDFVAQQQQQQQQQRQPTKAATPAERRRAALRQLAELLPVFLQVCAALHAMHALEPALAHRDIKPHNVLLRRRQADGATAAAAAACGSGGGGGGWPKAGAAMPPLAAPREAQSVRRQQTEDAPGWAAGEWGDGGGSDGGAAGAGNAPGAAAVVPVEHEGQRQERQQQGDEWWASRLPRWQQRHEAVLIDFGSARPARVEVRSRMEAMAVQEDAERHCTAPYRAPELWDVASSCTVDERVDVWSLGCLLYFMLCGQSPFERAAGEAGGSLMLAVVNGRLTWPDEAAADLPESLRRLVARCCDTDPAARPRVAEVAAAADRVLCQLPLE